jgi:hypothetical protein
MQTGLPQCANTRGEATSGDVMSAFRHRLRSFLALLLLLVLGGAGALPHSHSWLAPAPYQPSESAGSERLEQAPLSAWSAGVKCVLCVLQQQLRQVQSQTPAGVEAPALWASTLLEPEPVPSRVFVRCARPRGPPVV